jgi:Tol biopolymer transport system component
VLDVRAAPAVVGLCLSLVLGCGDGPSGPSRGDLRVVVSTTGTSPDADGYLLSLDQGTGQRVAASETRDFAALTAGTHQLAVSDIAPNCTLAGNNPRPVTIVAGQTTQLTLQISCGPPPGALRVNVTTTGFDLDSDGYTLLLDATPVGTLVAQGTLTLAAVAAGNHTVTLGGIASNCAMRIPRQQPLTINSAQETAVDLLVLCALASGVTAEQIVYESASQIHIVSSDGTGGAQLTQEPARAFVPSWSPDRTRIAFTSDRAAGNFNLWTMHPDGSDPVQLTSVAGDVSPSWSADGTRLVFESSTGAGLSVVNADGSGRVQITGVATDAYPSWSPDGTRIAFSRSPGPGPQLQLYLVQPDGSGLMQLPTPGITDCIYPRWSPDGTRLAFSGYDANGSSVWIVNDDGSGLRRVTPTDMEAFTPSWSPTGDRLAFYGQAFTGLGDDGIYVVRPDGSELTLRVADGIATTPAWAR